MLSDELYTPAELAEVWRCHVTLIYEMLRDGRLKGFKLGRDWRIRAEAVREYEQNPDNQSAVEYKPRNRQKEPARVMRVY